MNGDPERAGGRLMVPDLAGARVRLREFRATDVGVVQAASRDELIPKITTVPTTGDVDAALTFVERQHDRARTGVGYSFAITDMADVAVGQIGLWLRDLDRGRASVGYWIAADRRRRGFAADALATVVDWAWSLDAIHRLERFIEPWNAGSRRVAEAAGFEREGLLRSWQLVGTERRDMLIYSLLRRPEREGGD